MGKNSQENIKKLPNIQQYILFGNRIACFGNFPYRWVGRVYLLSKGEIRFSECSQPHHNSTSHPYDFFLMSHSLF